MEQFWGESQSYLRSAAQVVGWAAEGAGVLIVAVGIVRTLIGYVRHLLKRDAPAMGNDIRLELGRSLTLALEFLLAADVVQTAVAPTWEEIGQLAAIATIRTGLNFFLQREIAQERREQERERTARPSQPDSA